MKTRDIKPSLWIFSDGKAGDELQCLGVADALGVDADIRRVSPRLAYSWLMPWGPIDPRDDKNGSAAILTPPFPDLAIASGRRTVPYLRTLRSRSKKKTLTVFLKDPRTGAGTADVIWVPEHDRLRGHNVVVTPTAPHRITSDVLDAARANPLSTIARAQSPRIMVMVGGNSRHHQFSSQNITSFVRHLDELAQDGATLMITTSRRTPEDLIHALRSLATEGRHVLWSGEGPNPYIQFMAHADQTVVTADSTNMVGEALMTGKPVLTFEPDGGHPKISRFLTNLSKQGLICPFKGQLETYTYKPVNATPVIASAIRSALAKRFSHVAD
ncbi:MAG: mitochondrial fission ELM1 family protein [Stappiaceae bacterium]